MCKMCRTKKKTKQQCRQHHSYKFEDLVRPFPRQGVHSGSALVLVGTLENQRVPLRLAEFSPHQCLEMEFLDINMAALFEKT